MTATSRAQITRLIGQWLEHRKIVRRIAVRPAFAVRYTREDILLLAVADAAHEDLSRPGDAPHPAPRVRGFGKTEYERLAIDG